MRCRLGYILYLAGVILLPGSAILAAPSVTVSRDGTQLLGPDGAPLVLRGANWGWWGCVEPSDAKLIREWGGNLVRIAFLYTKVTLPGTDELGGEGLTLLDRMCQWAEGAGVWYVLDCHEPPAGCNTAPYVFGGLNRLWGSEEDQQRFVRMWVALARRYRSGRYLLAYELMNEPTPPKDYSLGEYRRLCLRLVDAIRAEDPGRFVVISPLDWSSVWGLKDSLLLPRPNLIYTFHFYSPYSVTHGGAKYPGKVTVSTRWIGNSPEGWGAQGNTDWHLLERTCRAPEGATHGVIMLRSDRNAGETWFDDVTLACDGQPTGFPANAGFDAEVRSAGWKVERQTAGEFTWNAAEGHAAPGSLRISGTDSYNAWVTTDRLAVRAGAEYRVGCWVKTRGATGWSYPCVAWFQDVEEVVDKAWIERQLKPAMGFSRRYRVPVWCGEFGCSQSNPDGSGFRWVRDVGMVLNRLGIAWTYWNWRESTNPGSMGVWVQVEGEYRQQESLSKLLRLLWRHGHGAG